MTCPFSIWCKDSNRRPLDHESSPVTTRPGLFTLICKALNVQNCKIDNVHFLKMEPLPIGKISFKLGKQTENKKSKWQAAVIWNRLMADTKSW